MSFTKNPATKDVAKLFDVQAIKRAVKNIILTNKYERPFNSDFGCNLRGFLFENITEPLLVIIKDRVAMAIEKYEPRVSVEDVVVQNDEENNGLNITKVNENISNIYSDLHADEKSLATNLEQREEARLAKNPYGELASNFGIMNDYLNLKDYEAVKTTGYETIKSV